MSNPADPTIKTLVEITPADWLRLTNHKPAATRIIDADAGTIRGAADKVIHVADMPPYLLHLEFQAGHDSARLPRRLRLYNNVLDDRHEMLVSSVAVILHPGADSPALTDEFKRAGIANLEIVRGNAA
jgi:hypothetical protein